MKIVLAVCLFVAGYLVGTIGPSVTAQAPVQLFDSNGNSTIYYPPSGPGGVGQYYGSNGQSGQIYSTPPMQGFSRQNPC